MKTLNAIILIIFLYPLPQRASAQEPAPENESIRQQDLRADLFFLSSDALQGRLTATRDNRIAAEFIKLVRSTSPPSILRGSTTGVYQRARNHQPL